MLRRIAWPCAVRGIRSDRRASRAGACAQRGRAGRLGRWRFAGRGCVVTAARSWTRPSVPASTDGRPPQPARGRADAHRSRGDRASIPESEPLGADVRHSTGRARAGESPVCCGRPRRSFGTRGGRRRSTTSIWWHATDRRGPGRRALHRRSPWASDPNRPQTRAGPCGKRLMTENTTVCQGLPSDQPRQPRTPYRSQACS